MIATDLNLKMIPPRPRDAGSRVRSSDPLLTKTPAPASSTRATEADTQSAPPAEDTFAANLDGSLASKRPETQSADLTAPKGNATPNEDIKVEPRQTLQTMSQAQSANRQTAMQVFLERMQSELGIDPERVVAAFGKLSNEDLMAPPEESAAKFIKLLDLNPKDSKKALDLYSDMLAMVAVTGMAQSLGNNGQQANIHVTDKEQEEIKILRSTINDMSDRFFMTGHYGFRQGHGGTNAAMVTQVYGKNAQALSPDVTSPLSNMSDEDKKTLGQEAVNADGQTVQNNLQNGPVSLAQVAALANQATAQQAVAASGSTATASATESSDDATEDILRKLVSNSAPKSANATANAAAAQAAQTPANMIDKTTIPTAASAMAAGNISTMGEKAESRGAGADSDKNDKGDDVAYGQVQQPQDLKTHLAGKTFNLQPEKVPSHADTQSNIKDIISKAQFLSKKGGGEMKVSLNPEGLGEVNLKVRIQNGQVNVEMVASNDDAKKSLEKGLTDLKASLATHKLNLESIRIDSPKEASNQLAQQRHDLERGFQQRFLSDFQDRNGASRHEMFEYPGPSVPSSQRRDVVSNSYAAKRHDNSRRLDLVA